MKDENRTDGQDRLADSFAMSTRPVVTVDINKYQAWLDDPDLTPEQKEDFLRSLWSVIMTFVELGFGVHPLQEVCGKNELTGTARAGEAFNRVRLPEPKTPLTRGESAPTGGLEAE